MNQNILLNFTGGSKGTIKFFSVCFESATVALAEAEMYR